MVHKVATAAYNYHLGPIFTFDEVLNSEAGVCPEDKA